MKEYTIRCDYCEDEFKSPHSFRKYCSDLCRSRFNQRKNGNAAKPFKCLQCGEMFKRRSAKNTRCKTCRNNTELGQKVISNEENLPKLDREVELSMIQNWIDNPKNKIKVG